VHAGDSAVGCYRSYPNISFPRSSENLSRIKLDPPRPTAISPSALKRPHSPSNAADSGSLKKSRQASKVTVVLGDQTNGRRISVDGDPHSITAHDIYKVIATVKGEGGEERSTKRKEMLSELIDG